MSAPAIILVAPQMGENIGAAARAMLNFGLTHMRIVAPRDGWPNPKAVAMASGAGRILDDALVSETTTEAIGDLTHVYATTARPREMTKAVFTPEGAVADAAKRIAAGEKVGVLFGGERAGLSNEDVIRANSIITVPTNPDFSSLNLAQCVLLMCYEWRRQNDDTPEETLHTGKSERAEAVEVERLTAHLIEDLDAAGFFFPDNKREHMVGNLSNLLRRMPMTSQDARTLHGVIRALSEKRRSS
ncbi:MAG: RNA methyltransferase [Pseudomonadota bacterium]